jgi:heme exporter protein CcmB
VTFLQTVWLIVRKDLTIEFRSREIAYTTLFFAVAVVLVFAFALVKEGMPPQGASAAVLWIAILFAGNLALGRTFERERQAETLRALLLAPVSRPAIYTGKLVALLVLLGAAEVLLVPLVAFLFQEPLLRHPIWMTGIVFTGTTGFAAVGTLFAAMLVRARSRDMLLPLMLYTITVPVIIAGVGATSSLLQTDVNYDVVRFWTVLLTCFDVVFVTIALWTFDAVMGEQ